MRNNLEPNMWDKPHAQTLTYQLGEEWQFSFTNDELTVKLVNIICDAPLSFAQRSEEHGMQQPTARP